MKNILKAISIIALIFFSGCDFIKRLMSPDEAVAKIAAKDMATKTTNANSAEKSKK